MSLIAQDAPDEAAAPLSGHEQEQLAVLEARLLRRAGAAADAIAAPGAAGSGDPGMSADVRRLLELRARTDLADSAGPAQPSGSCGG